MLDQDITQQRAAVDQALQQARPDIERALEQAQLALAQRELAQGRTDAPAPAGAPAPPPAPGEAFRVEEGGRVVEIGPGGVKVHSAQTAQPPMPFTPTVPAGAVAITIALFVTIAAIIIGWPLARAFARRMDRAAVAPPRATADSERLQRIEQAVEAMAIEVERVSENQRYVTKLLAEGRAPDAALLARPMAEAAPEPDRR